MSVSSNPLATFRPFPAEYIANPSNPTGEYKIAGSITGTATGGIVTMDVILKDTNRQGDHIILTNLAFATDEATAGARLIVSIAKEELDDLMAFPNLVATHTILWDFELAIKASYTCIRNPRGNLPIYLGKLSSAGTGNIKIIYDTNTDTKLYRFLATFLAFRRRPLFPSMYFPVT